MTTRVIKNGKTSHDKLNLGKKYHFIEKVLLTTEHLFSEEVFNHGE